jgi:hypothetical protein
MVQGSVLLQLFNAHNCSLFFPTPSTRPQMLLQQRSVADLEGDMLVQSQIDHEAQPSGTHSGFTISDWPIMRNYLERSLAQLRSSM